MSCSFSADDRTTLAVCGPFLYSGDILCDKELKQFAIYFARWLTVQRKRSVLNRRGHMPTQTPTTDDTERVFGLTIRRWTLMGMPAAALVVLAVALFIGFWALRS